MGGLFFDTFRDVAAPHYTAGIWATRVANSGNLSSQSDIVFGTALTNSSGLLPLERMRLDAAGGLCVGRQSAQNANGNPGFRARVAISASGNAQDCALFVDNFGDGLGSGIQSVLHPDSVGGMGWHMQCLGAAGAGSGGIYQNTPTTITFITSSDRRLKQDIVDAPDQGERIDAIQVREFAFKETPDTRVVGFIAQELHAVEPTAVFKGDAGEDVTQPWGVDPSKLVAMLVKEVQELRKRVAVLEELK